LSIVPHICGRPDVPWKHSAPLTRGIFSAAQFSASRTTAEGARPGNGATTITTCGRRASLLSLAPLRSFFPVASVSLGGPGNISRRTRHLSPRVVACRPCNGSVDEEGRRSCLSTPTRGYAATRVAMTGIGQELAAGMTKKRRTYLPRIVGTKVMMPAPRSCSVPRVRTRSERHSFDRRGGGGKHRLYDVDISLKNLRHHWNACSRTSVVGVSDLPSVIHFLHQHSGLVRQPRRIFFAPGSK